MYFQGAVFDLDGTLLDSMGMWEQLDRKFLSRRGIALPRDYTEKISGYGFAEAARYTIKRFNLKEKPEALIGEWHALVAAEYKERIVLNIGAKAYLEGLQAAGVRLAVATSLPVKLFTPCLERNGVAGLFKALLSTEMVARDKEYPDLFLAAAERLQVRPEECLVFEDVLPAIKSAKAAGMKVCAVCNRYNLDQQPEFKKLADFCIAGFSQAPWPDK